MAENRSRYQRHDDRNCVGSSHKYNGSTGRLLSALSRLEAVIPLTAQLPPLPRQIGITAFDHCQLFALTMSLATATAIGRTQ